MKLFIALLALLAIAIVVFFVLKNRKKSESDSTHPDKNFSLKHSHHHSASPATKAAPSQPEPLQTSDTATIVEKAAETVQPTQNSTVVNHIANAEPVDALPEDSSLRRHYLSTLQSKKTALSNPYPTDSTLKRHYESILVANLSTVEEPAEENRHGSETAPCSQSNEAAQPKTIIPEDSTLKRHFLTQVQSEIETLLFPRPTDSTLRRHYDALVKAQMQTFLGNSAV